MTVLKMIMLWAIPLVAFSHPEGLWCTFDDKTGEKRAYVELTVKQGELTGKIVKRFLKPGDPEYCVHCPKPFTDQPIQGLSFMWGLKQGAEGEWISGRLIDPRSGHIYRVQLKEEHNALKVRGYLGVSWIGRTQTWTRVNTKDVS